MQGIINNLYVACRAKLHKRFNAMAQKRFVAYVMILFWQRVAKSATATGSNDDNRDFFGHKRYMLTSMKWATS